VKVIVVIGFVQSAKAAVFISLKSSFQDNIKLGLWYKKYSVE
jgi:hypothetical protein